MTNAVSDRALKYFAVLCRRKIIMSSYFTSEYGFSHYDKFVENNGIYACIPIFSLSCVLFKSFKITLLGNMLLTSFLITVQTVRCCCIECSSTYGWQSIVDPSLNDDTNLVFCLVGDPNSVDCDAIVYNVGKNYVSCADKFPSTCVSTSFGAYCSVLPANNYNTPYYWCTVKMNNIWTAGFGLAVVALTSEGLIILICLFQRFASVHDLLYSNYSGDSIWHCVVCHCAFSHCSTTFFYLDQHLFSNKSWDFLHTPIQAWILKEYLTFSFPAAQWPTNCCFSNFSCRSRKFVEYISFYCFAIPTVTTDAIFIGKIWYSCVKEEDLLQNKLLPWVVSYELHITNL